MDLTALLNRMKNRYLPPHRREEGSLKNYNGERPNLIKTTTPQRVYANNNPITQPGVYNEPLPLAGGTTSTISPPLGVGINRDQQIPQPFMQPPPLNSETIRKVVQELYEPGLR